MLTSTENRRSRIFQQVLSVVPSFTYTDPEIARVSLSEREAKERGIEYEPSHLRIYEFDRSIVEREELGFVKLLRAKRTDKILGVTLVAAHAGELLPEFVLAMKNRIGLGRLATIIYAYPTFAELGRKVGDAYNKQRLTPFARKIFGLLYTRTRSRS